MTETTIETSTQQARPTKRDVTATVTAVAVTFALGVGWSLLSGRIQQMVHDKIAPPKTETE